MNPPDDIKSSEITPKQVYLNRRLFMRGAVLAATTTATALIYRKLNPPALQKPKGETLVTCEVQDGRRGAQGLCYKREIDCH